MIKLYHRIVTRKIIKHLQSLFFQLLILLFKSSAKNFHHILFCLQLLHCIIQKKTVVHSILLNNVCVGLDNVDKWDQPFLALDKSSSYRPWTFLRLPKEWQGVLRSYQDLLLQCQIFLLKRPI